jgi:hypothetical protein
VRTDLFTIERSVTVPTEAAWEALSGHVSPLQGWLEARRSAGDFGMPGGLRLKLTPALSGTLLVQVRRVKRLRPRPVDVVMERGIYALDPVELADWHDQALASLSGLEEGDEPFIRDVERGGLLASLMLAGAYEGRLPATVPRPGERGLERALLTRRELERALVEQLLDCGSEVRFERAKLIDATLAHHHLVVS